MLVSLSVGHDAVNVGVTGAKMTNGKVEAVSQVYVGADTCAVAGASIKGLQGAETAAQPYHSSCCTCINTG